VVAFALDQGEGALFAGNLLAFMGLAGLVGVLAAGAWSDRSGPVWPTLACFVLRIAIFALILVDRSPLAIAVFALGYGMTFWATAPLTVIFVRDLFGNRNLGMISGLVTMGHHIAGGLGALTGAMLFDTDGDYLAAFALMLVLSNIASAVTWRFARRSGP
jgi:predicted MFS family arabinose efflux permease